MREFDYIIIGGGCAGLSLAYELEINNKLKEVNQLRETLDISDININTSQKNHFYKKLFNNQNNKKNYNYRRNKKKILQAKACWLII